MKTGQLQAGQPEARREVFTPPPRNAKSPLIAAAVVVVLIFGGVGAWSATAPIQSAVVAPGVIAVETDKRTIQHLEGGIVSEILIKEGSHVRQGELLVRLDDTRVKSQEEVTKSERDSQMAAEARLIAERDDQSKVTFPDELIARRSDPKVAEILDLQDAQFATRRKAINGQRQILQQRIQQLEDQIVGLRALQVSKRRQAELIKEEMNMIEGLVKAGIVTRQRFLSLQREASRLDGEEGDHVASIAKTNQAVGETKLQILQLDNDRHQEITKELRDVQSKRIEASERLKTIQDQYRRLEIVAPVDGTVLNLGYVTMGGVVPPGATILNIVPSNDKLIVQAQISPADIDSVFPGQKVHIRFVTAATKQVPVLDGTLEYVSADRQTPEARQGMGSSSVPALVPNAFYTGRVTVDQNELAKLDKVALHAGMPVEVLINRGERTVMEYIMAPLANNFARAFKER